MVKRLFFDVITRLLVNPCPDVPVLNGYEGPVPLISVAIYHASQTPLASDPNRSYLYLYLGTFVRSRNGPISLVIVTAAVVIAVVAAAVAAPVAVVVVPTRTFKICNAERNIIESLQKRCYHNVLKKTQKSKKKYHVFFCRRGLPH